MTLRVTGLVMACLSQAVFAVDGSSREACNGVVSGSLLQRAKGETSESSQLAVDLLLDPTDTLALVMNLSEKVINSKYKLSTDEESLLATIDMHINNVTLPSLEKETAEQQKLLDDEYENLKTFRNESQLMTNHLDGMTSKLEGFEAEHVDCRAKEADHAAANKSAWKKLHEWVQGSLGGADLFSANHPLPFNPSDTVVEDMPELAPVLSNWFKEVLPTLTSKVSLAKSLSDQKLALWDSAKNATSQLEAVRNSCNKLQDQYETGYCEWHEQGLGTEQKYVDVNLKIEEIENATRHLDASQEARKNMWSSAKRIQCFTGVITEKEPSKDMVENCSEFDIDTSHLDLKIREDADELMATMSEKTGHDLKFMPGQPSWVTQHYANLSEDAPREETTPCLHSESCSDFPCTDGYKLKENAKEIIPDALGLDECCMVEESANESANV